MASSSEQPIRIRDHGTALEGQTYRVRCNYCDKVVSGFSRLKCHLGGIRGDVLPCLKVPENVKEAFKNEVLEKKRADSSKEVEELQHPSLPLKKKQGPTPAYTSGSKRQNRAEMDSLPVSSWTESIAFPNRMISSEAVPGDTEDSSLREGQKRIGRFFYETGIEFSAAMSPSFERLINSTLGSGQLRHRIPTCQDLKGWILQDVVKEMQQYAKEIKDSWESTGCSILLDGWENSKGMKFVNILIDCPRGTLYLRSCNISAIGGDINAMLAFFNHILEEVGIQNVVQIITYSTSTFMKELGTQVMENNRTLFWTVSASHCLELMLNKFLMFDSFKDILEKAKTITRFVYSNAAILKLMKDCGRVADLVKPSKIRSITTFLTLENIVIEEDRVVRFFTSSDWKMSRWASTAEGKGVANLVANQSFWSGAMMVLHATIPVVRVLELLNKANKPKIGYIYDTMDQVKEEIKNNLNHEERLYLPLWKVIDEIWNENLHSPLHCAAYFLNPCYFYSGDFFTDHEVSSGLCNCVTRLAENKTTEDLITRQLDEYRMKKGALGEGSSKKNRSDLDPANWWMKYGGRCPELQRFAIRILSQTCNGSSKYRLKRSLAEMLCTEGRNPIEQERLNYLAFVHYNLHLQNFQPSVSNDISADEIDPMDDWIVDK